MKVGILTQYYPPEVGAPQVRLSKLARRFAERGHKVFVLTAMPNYPKGKIYPGYGGLFHREERDAVSVIRSYIYPTTGVEIAPRLVSYFSFVFSSLIVGTICLPKLDYLITESPPLLLGLAGYFLSRMKKARWIFNVSDLWPETLVSLKLMKEGWDFRTALLLETFCYQKAWLVTGQSREITEDIKLRFPSVFTYHFSNAVDTSLFSPQCRSLNMRDELAEDNVCIVVYAGLHGACQGLEQVLKVAAELKDMKDLCIVFVGDGVEKKQLMKRAQALNLTNVRFLEPYPHEKMPALLASADIALVPLKVRFLGGVPSKLYEAMSVGIPVLLMTEGEAADIVNKYQCGIVVSAGDVRGAVSALRKLVKDVDIRKQMGDRGRKAAIMSFNGQSIINKFIDFLEGRIRC